MLTQEQNDLLTRVGPGTKMGDYLRRYWMPIAGVSEFDQRATKPVRLFGEDLVLYRDLSGNFGLVARQCAHRRADLAHGIVEKCGLRCNYHGWTYDGTGQCIEQPFEDTSAPERNIKASIKIAGYPVGIRGGMVWAYMGPLPAPCLPDWEPFSRPNVFTQIIVSEVPCNWLQCQENSIDPVHFEWNHEYWDKRLREGETANAGPKHTKLDFSEFEHGFVYKRVRENSDESHPFWTIGRVALWPIGFFLGDHFEFRVPIDDENTLSIAWRLTHVPKDREPYVQKSIPTWYGPLKDDEGEWITSHVLNQDFIAWVGQGRIMDRTQERLGASDRGIVMVRRRFLADLEEVAQGRDPKGLIRDPAQNVCVKLPMANHDTTLRGFTTAEIMADPRRRAFLTSFYLQAGQPEWVKRAMSEAMGVDYGDFKGIAQMAPGRSVNASETKGRPAGEHVGVHPA
ncbi:aromatic ring-hydroxylating dioxygenase subunit alpha [Variovorax sp. N23]|uniref:aromatic ring-hydroxylating dioxygenase subunit alpha n=1 Tax=Variovorax sp. N23 TaxID=2980555 RepID=UPI0021C5CEA1|nr:aromatic ring-hydroxylating dioxygenase subunit alpha [Variovorax sp. N23]MCU4119048.1 aromatic ring-hydroxylating dioxygenase subunit alpha [Variovorax sp. N23]